VPKKRERFWKKCAKRGKDFGKSAQKEGKSLRKKRGRSAQKDGEVCVKREKIFYTFSLFYDFPSFCKLFYKARPLP
jgi:hypothetical protein